MMHRKRRIFGMAIAMSALLWLSASCTQTCQDACMDQFDDCMEVAPPGASKVDCETQYQQCMQSCAALLDDAS